MYGNNCSLVSANVPLNQTKDICTKTLAGINNGININVRKTFCSSLLTRNKEIANKMPTAKTSTK